MGTKAIQTQCDRDRKKVKRFCQRLVDNEKAKKGLLASKAPHIPMTMSRCLEILEEHISIIMMEGEGAREHIIWLEQLLLNPAEMDMYKETPESLHRQIAEQKAHIKHIKSKFWRLDRLLMDIVLGRFGDEHLYC